MHEILTVQLGQQSNYLATHFWNTQESYFTYSADETSPVDHDIHWRPGVGADGSETFMPRTVIYDLKGGFGSLRKINALYEAQEDGPPQGLWNGPTVVHRQQPIEASAYQQSLDAGSEPPPLTTSTVRYWSDFNRVFFHPRSVVQMNEYELNSSLMPFEKWATGEDLFQSLDKEHDLLDRDLRFFAEEADQMQGVQVFAGFDDAWGGFASRYVERLRDEYGKATIWIWGLQEPFLNAPREKRLLRLANKARTLVEVYKQASLVVPLTLPQPLPRSVSLNPASSWHTSALLSSVVESATLGTRLRDTANRDTLGDMSDQLNAHGKQSIAGLQMSVVSTPEGKAEAINGIFRDRNEEQSREGVRLDMDFSPADQMEAVRQRNGVHSATVFSQLLTMRGEFAHDDEDVDDGEREDERLAHRRPNDFVSRRYQSSLKLPLLDSFPRIFRDEEGRSLEGSAEVIASLSTDSSVAARLNLLRSTVTRSIGLEDRETLSNELAEMAEEYHEGWSSGSDEGDDD